MIKKVLNKSFLYRYLAYRVQKWSVERNPMMEIHRNYKIRFNKLPNLENPKNLIEKIYWMQFHCDTSQWTLCADKYRMREYVKERGLEKYLPKIYGVWGNPDDMNWEELPNQFVLKANNGCATVLVVKDKSRYKASKIKKMLRQWMAIPYGYRGYQPHYLKIKPCVFAEELLTQSEELNKLSPNSIVDFKVWCFNGKVENIFLTFNRNGGNLSLALYDINWNAMPEKLRKNGTHCYKPIDFPRPKCLEEMIAVASELSKGMPQVRVDFYEVNGKPVLGELTMAAGYGSFTEEYYNYLGELTDVSLLKKIK